MFHINYIQVLKTVYLTHPSWQKKRTKAHVTNSQSKNLYNASHIFIMMFMQRNEKCTYKFNAVVPLRVYIYVTLAVQVLPKDRMSLPSYQIKKK